ncbi:MAG: RNA-directed DNA polymerase [Gammaproteobacteria bacterium]|nr:RNA-directed DNA polymerase [Gammaproteobacteria bacterium]
MLAIRALQATRKLHLPTYVATRFFVDSIVGYQDSSWSYVTIPRKYPMRKQGQFLVSKKLKKILENGCCEYRDFLVSSPSTALTESLILAYLSQESSFHKENYIYSYRWPNNTEECPYNFEHYINGYKCRNNDILNLLLDNSNNIVIVSDIENFYPSINQETVLKKFNQALKDTKIQDSIKVTALKFIEHLFNYYPDGKGIPIGPEISHILADFALSTIDTTLSAQFPGRYFRYVDDIVLVVDNDKKNSVIEMLENLASDEGLTIHPQKTDCLSGSEWLTYGPHTQHQVRRNSFESLVFFIKVFLLTHRNREDELATSLLEEGFSLPISRLTSKSRESNFFGNFKYLLERRWNIAWQAWKIRKKDLIKMAREVRNEVKRELYDILLEKPPENKTRKKWFLQRLRYLTNRSIYLFPPNELTHLVEHLSPFPEFQDTIALINLLVKDSYKDILGMPGPVLNTAASLLRQANRKLPPITLDSHSDQVIIDSVSILLLFGVVDLQRNALIKVNQTTSELLQFCANQPKSSDMQLIQDFSYINEIRTLQYPHLHDSYVNILETRFSDLESPVLDALDIGGGYLSW